MMTSNSGRSMLAFALLLAIVLTTSVAYSQDRVRRIGLLFAGGEKQRDHLDKALVESLARDGYVEGRNLVIERRTAGGNFSVLPDHARELESLKLDTVVTTCTASTLAMKDATATTPIVMAVVADPVGQGVVSSLRHPGKNITGTSSQFEEILPKMLEILSEILGRPATVAVLYNSESSVHARLWPLAERYAQALRLRLVRFDLPKTGTALQTTFAAIAKLHADAVFPLPDDPFFYNRRQTIVELAAAQRLPGVFFASEFVEAGGLLSYGESMAEGYRRAASYVSKIARGAKPGELPIEQPTRFEVVINLKTAKALGIKVPQSVLLRADRVIE